MSNTRFQKNNLIATYSKTEQKYRVRPVGKQFILEEFRYAASAFKWMSQTKDYVRKAK